MVIHGDHSDAIVVILRFELRCVSMLGAQP